MFHVAGICVRNCRFCTSDLWRRRPPAAGCPLRAPQRPVHRSTHQRIRSRYRGNRQPWRSFMIHDLSWTYKSSFGQLNCIDGQVLSATNFTLDWNTVYWTFTCFFKSKFDQKFTCVSRAEKFLCIRSEWLEEASLPATMDASALQSVLIESNFLGINILFTTHQSSLHRLMKWIC